MCIYSSLFFFYYAPHFHVSFFSYLLLISFFIPLGPLNLFQFLQLHFPSFNLIYQVAVLQIMGELLNQEHVTSPELTSSVHSSGFLWWRGKILYMGTMESFNSSTVVAHSCHKLPLLSNQKSEVREQDQLGWELEHILDRGVGVFLRWEVCTLLLNLANVISRDFLKNPAGRIWLR